MIFVAGAGNDYCSLVQNIPFEDYVLLDSDPNKIGKLICGRKVYDFYVLKDVEDSIVYISSERYYCDIYVKIKLINQSISIQNLAEYVWMNKAAMIPKLIADRSPKYEVVLEMKAWLDNALSEEMEFWKWAVKNAIESRDFRLTKRNFEYDGIELKGDETIVDVGAGPLPKFGNLCRGFEINYRPVDPLAYEYKKIITNNGACLPVNTEFAIGEMLSKFYSSESVDYVIMHNALDHCIDPLRVLIEMLKICKIGGSILLYHADSEGMFENYVGLHKWNISEYNKEMVIFDNKDNLVNVSVCFKEFADVYVRREPIDYRDGIACNIKKTAPLPSDIDKMFSDVSGELIKVLFSKLSG